MKRTLGAMHGGLGFLALALAACSTQRPAPPTRPATPPPAPQPLAPPRAATPLEFVAAAGSIDLFVVRASDMALARSGDARVRALAMRLTEEHRGLAAQLSIAGRRLDALPAARLMDREQRLLTLLDAEQRFDAAFVRQMISAHTRSWALHARFAAHGASPTLRPVAANGERVERAHLALLGQG